MRSMLTQRYLTAWAKAFAFTLAVEVPIYVLVTRKHVPVRRAAAAGALCSIVTHPLLWFVWPRLFGSYTPYIITGELVVCVVESFIFYFVARPPSLALAVAASFLANAASFGLGRVCHRLGLL